MAEVTDLASDLTQEYQELRRVAIQAITNTRTTAGKTWLTAAFLQAETAADTGATVLVHEWEQDDQSDAHLRLKTVMSRTLSENTVKGATAWAKLEALFAELATLI